MSAAILAAGRAGAADPQPYTVTVAATGSSALDAVLQSSSQLIGLKDKVPVPPFALVGRAQSDIARFQTVLDSFGFYQNKVTITVADRPVTDPELPDVLDDMPAGSAVVVKVAIDKGQLYRLGRIALDGPIPDADRPALGLHSGDPAIANAVLGAQGRLLAALQEDGYALAVVDAPAAFADDAGHTVNLTYKVTPGPRADIGVISFKGLKDVYEDFLHQVLTIHPGDRYRPNKIEAARQALAALGVFSGVTVHAADHLSADGRIPLMFDVTERPEHAVVLSGTYSTDLGISLGATWSHRNLFGNAEQLNLSAAGTGLGTSSAGLGYNLSAQFIKPEFLENGQTLEFDLIGLKQQLDAYDQTAETLTGYLRRKYSTLWSGSVGLSAEYDRVRQEGDDRRYQLIAAPITASYDSTGLSDLLQDPVSGARGSFAVTPTHAFGASNLNFLVLQTSGSTYFDLGDPGRSVLALRALAGSILGGSNLELPPDQRLYAGGSATVRGFAYQSIGPQFPDKTAVGAKSVDAATIEFRQRLWDDYGAAAFVDVGQASGNGAPFNGAVRIGAGIGARYYTPLGPVRADIAVPLNRIKGGDSFELYIGLGQAF